MIKITDHPGTFTAEQTQSLTDKATAYPFDVFVTIGAVGSKADFQAEVLARVSGPHILSIGVDPAHRYTQVNGSVDLGLPDGRDLAAAGNRFFKSGDLVGGIDAIAAKAIDLRLPSRVVESAVAPIVVQEHPMANGWWYGLGGIGAVCLAFGAWVWIRRRAREKALEAVTADYRAMNAELNNAVGDKRIAEAEQADELTLPVYTPRARPWSEIKRSATDPVRAARVQDRVDLELSQTPVVIVQNDPLPMLVLADALTPRETVVVVDPPSPSITTWGSPDPQPSYSSSSYDSSSSSSSYDSSSSSSSWDSGGSDWSGGSSGSDW